MNKKLGIIIIVISLLLVTTAGLVTADCNTLNVEPITQIKSCSCYKTSLAMVMRYYDDNYGTNFFGNPYDEDLFKEWIYDLVDIQIDLYGRPLGSTTTNRLNSWADYRNQPRPVSVIQYTDISTTYIGYQQIDITQEFIVNELEEDRPVYFSVPGHSSVAIGWCDDELTIYNTWDTQKHYKDTDSYIPGNKWYIESVIFIDYDLDKVETNLLGDMNGDGVLNSADVRYLMLFINHRAGYRNLHAGGDVNSDGVLTIEDAIYLSRYMVGHPDYSIIYP